MPARTPAQRIVIESREKIYDAHKKVFPPLKKPRASGQLKKRQLYGQPFWGAKKDFWHDDPGGVGREIVREMMVCPACAEALARKKKPSIESSTGFSSDFQHEIRFGERPEVI